MECLQNKRADWTFRITQEQKRSKSSYFITLTYDDEHLPSGGLLSKRDLTLFIKRLRKSHEELSNDITMLLKDHKISSEWPAIRYYGIGEYGEHTFRPHYHLIMFNLRPEWINKYLEKTWKVGFVKVGTVTTASIHYVTKYVINRINQKYEVEPFALMSKKLGIEYLRENWPWHKSGLKNYVISESGVKQRMPRYYSDKVFNFKEKQKIYEENIERINSIENENIEMFKNSHEYFSDRIENRKQKTYKFSKLNKKDKL